MACYLVFSVTNERFSVPISHNNCIKNEHRIIGDWLLIIDNENFVKLARYCFYFPSSPDIDFFEIT